MRDTRKRWEIDPGLERVAVDWKGLLENDEQAFLTDNQLSAFVDPKKPGCQRIHFYPLPFAHEFPTGKWSFAELMDHDCLKGVGPSLDLSPEQTSLTFLPSLVTKRMRLGDRTITERCAVSGETLAFTWDLPGLPAAELSFRLPFTHAQTENQAGCVVASVRNQAFVALAITGAGTDMAVDENPWACRIALRPTGKGAPIVLGLSCGYEREKVIEAAREAAGNPHGLFAAAERTWDEWFTRMVPRFSCSDRTLEKLYYYQAYVTRAALCDIPHAPFTHPYTCPWKTSAVWQWSWNTPIDSIAERWLNDKTMSAGGNLLMLENGGALNIGTYLHPVREIRELRGHNEHMGFIGRCRGAMPVPVDLPVLTTLPHTTPNGLLGLWELFLCSGDRDLLRSFLRLMVQAEREFSRHRIAGGLCTCTFVDEFDYSLRLKPFIAGFRKGDPEMMLKMDTPFIAVDYNCSLHALRERIIAAAETLGDATVDTRTLRSENEQLRAAINAELWDPQTGFYYDMDPRTMRRSPVKSIAAFSALYAGIASKPQAERLVAHLSDPNEFGSPYPFPSVSLDTPEIDPSLITYGGDSMLVSCVWFPVEGLVRYGYRSLAAQSVLKAIAMVTREGPSSSYSYHSVTARYNQDKHTLTTQSVILTDLVCKYLVGIVPGPNGTFTVDPLALAASGIESFSFGPYRYCDRTLRVQWSRADGYRVRVTGAG
jgi:hypothetical protein